MKLFMNEFLESLAIDPQSHALITTDNPVMTYGKLLQCITDLGSFIPKRSLVFIISKNSIGSIIGYLTCISMRSVPLLLDSSIKEPYLLKLIKLYRPHYLLVPGSFMKDFQFGKKLTKVYDYDLYALDGKSARLPNNELALLLTTSGSTGNPKMVRLSYKNIITNSMAIIKYLKITKEDKPITTLSMSYSYGLSIINTHILSGSSIILNELSIISKGFWSYFEKTKPTSISGVPYHFELLNKLNTWQYSFSSIKKITQAGGHLDSAIKKEFISYCVLHNKLFFTMYGQTEATARMSYVPPHMALDKCDSIGKPVEGGHFQILDSLGELIRKPREQGALVYLGANVCLGYATDRNDLLKGDEFEGVLNTGDIAWFDEDGFYYLSGRQSRLGKLFGIRVNLDDIERHLRKSNIEAACIATSTGLSIFVVGVESLLTTRLTVKELLKSSENGVRYISIPRIPRAANGKILYSQLKEE